MSRSLRLKVRPQSPDTPGMAKRGWIAAACALVMACGGDEGADEGEPLEELPDVVGDAAVPSSDAGDAGVTRSDAAVANGGVDSNGAIRTAGSCVPEPAVSDLNSSVECLTSSDLAARGCVLGNTFKGSISTVKATRAQMESTRYAIVYTVPGTIETYLCTGTVPQTGWVCGGVGLQNCSFAGEATDCSSTYLLTPVPTQWLLCPLSR